MSEEELIEYVAGHTGQSRRKFIERLLVGAAFAAPVIASFSIGGAAAPKRGLLDAGANLPACGPNSFDNGPNGWFDYATNALCDPGSGANTTTTTAAPTTTASPTTTTASPTTTVAVTTTTGLGSGAGVPGEIPATK